jgi:hypothetical protein
MPKLKQYVGLDVSLKETSIAVIDENDKLVWRGSVLSTPEAIAEALRSMRLALNESGSRPVNSRPGFTTVSKPKVAP